MPLICGELNILGDFWDSYIYKDRLYLWTMNGEVIALDWKRLKPFVGQNMYLETNDIENYRLELFNNETENLHTDIDIFDDDIYYITDDGLFKVRLNNNSNNIKAKADKIWDSTLLSLEIRKNGRMALSAGQEGLYEYDINENINMVNRKYFPIVDNSNKILRISEKESLFSNWLYSSIYSSSYRGQSFMAGFNWDFKKTIFEREIGQDEIFKDHEKKRLSWGFGDKIFRVNDTGLEYVTFTQTNLSRNGISPFSSVKKIQFQRWKGRIIYAGASNFGVIVECEHALVIMNSEGKYHNIEGPITRWRVFSKSKEYNNQLHVITDNMMTIYFVDKKYCGINNYITLD